MSGTPSPDPRKRAGWRRGSTPTTAPKIERAWHGNTNQNVRTAAQKNLRRRIVATLLFTSALGLIAAGVWYISRIPVSTPLLVLTVAGYADPQPPNAWAKEDFDAFERAWKSSAEDGFSLVPFRLPKTTRNIAVAKGSKIWSPTDRAAALAEFREQLRTLRPGGPEEETKRGHGAVVIYLSGHGVLNDKQEPCLMLPQIGVLQHADALGAEPAYLADDLLLPVADLLACIKDVLPADWRKLLVLDCSRIDVHFGLGILYNGFADRLKQTYDFLDVPQLSIMSSADSGQVSWASPERSGSIFARFVRLGLQGVADRNGNGRVTLSELHDYVAKNTRGAVAQYDDRQDVVLLPTNFVDFNVAFSKQNPTEQLEPTSATAGGDLVAATQTTADESWLPIDRLWKIVERASPWNGDATGPNLGGRIMAWEELRQSLLRLERVRRAGEFYRTEADDLERKLEQLARDYWPWLPEPGTSAEAELATSSFQVRAWHSLPLARCWGDLRDDHDQNTQLMNGLLATPAVVPKTMPPLKVRAAAAWERAKNGNFKNEFATIDAFVRPPEQRTDLAGEIEPIEYHFLRLLAAAAPPTARYEQALATRERAEKAAAVAGDERIHYWVRQLVDEADAQRRSAEDLFFLGNDDQSEVEHEFSKADGLYEAAIALAAQLRMAFQTRDHAFADLPYYARWLTRRRSPTAGISPKEVQLLDQLGQAAEQAVKLDQQLEKLLDVQLDLPSRHFTDDEQLKQGLSDVRTLATQLQQRLSDFQDSFHRTAEDVSRLAENAVARREAIDLLEIPLLKADLRRDLRERVRRSPPSTEVHDSTEPTVAEAQPNWTAHWLRAQHPAWLLLREQQVDEEIETNNSANPAIQDKTRVYTQGREMRAALRRLPNQAHPESASAGDGEGPPLRRWNLQRKPYATADRRLRRGMTFLPASWLSVAKSSPYNPTRKLQEFDLHALRVWHGLRACDDFWGPMPDPRGPRNSYFVKVAGSYVLAAEGSIGKSPLSHELTDLLTKRELAARTALGIQLEPSIQPPTSTEFEVQFAAEFPTDVPSGRGAFYIERSAADGKHTGRRTPVVIGNGKRPAGFPYRASYEFTSSNKPGDWQLVGFYRGHGDVQAIHPGNAAQMIETAWSRPTTRNARVNVFGQGMAKGTIALILDCSASMDEGFARRGEGPQAVTPRKRMTDATDAVGIVTNALAQGGGYRFSLWFYGHRLWFDKSTGTFKQLEDSVRNFGVVPKDLTPQRDVQNVWTQRVLNDSSLPDLQSTIGKAEPRGITPLFESMKQALQNDMSAAAATKGPRHLIVVTDGEDTAGDNYKSDFKGREEVIRILKADAAAHEERIRVSVIGCGPEVQDSLRGLEDYMRRNGAEIRFFSAQSLEELTKSLQEALHLYEYQVVADDDGISSGRQSLNREVTIERLDPYRKAVHHVELIGTDVKSKPFFLEGGESIQLYLNVGSGGVGGLQLYHKRYEFRDGYLAGNPDTCAPSVAAPAASGRDPRVALPGTYHLVAGPPELHEQGDVRFPIAIQNGNEKLFSPRPAEAWIEITPLTQGRPVPDGRRYVFYDLAYREKVPVPVVECIARDWPKTADKAKIEIWWKPSPTPGENRQSILLGDPDSPEAAYSMKVSATRTSQFTWKYEDVPNGGTRVIVTEKLFADGSEAAPPNDLRGLTTRVVMRERPGDAPPTNVRRSYAIDGSGVVHTFEVETQNRRVLGNYTLEIIKAADFKAAALSLPRDQPLIVGLPNDE